MDELSEAEIARQVFERGDDFVPVDDSVVRSSARQLRIKLKEYFDGEGRDEGLRVEVPKGSCVPVFTKPAQGSPGVAADLPPRASPWLGASFAGNAILLLALMLMAWGRQGQPRVPDSLVASFVRGTTGTIPLVLSDFSLAGMKHLGLQEKAHRIMPDQNVVWDSGLVAPEDEATEDRKRAFALLRGHRLTRSGDVALTVRVMQASGMESRLTMRYARDVSPRELRGGSHIILGNPNSTPWAEPYEEHLGLRWMRGRGSEDLHPQPGEPSTYLLAENAFMERGTGYGRLAVAPNRSGQGQVLLISGVNMMTMEAEGEAAVDPKLSPEIRAWLVVAKEGPLPALEVPLKIEAVDNTPQHARVVKARLPGGARGQANSRPRQ